MCVRACACVRACVHESVRAYECVCVCVCVCTRTRAFASLLSKYVHVEYV